VQGAQVRADQSAEGLAVARPVYVLVDGDYGKLLRDQPAKTAAFVALLASRYRPMRSGELGTWYARR